MILRVKADATNRNPTYIINIVSMTPLLKKKFKVSTGCDSPNNSSYPSNSFLTINSNTYLIGEIYSITFRGGMIFSVFVVKPENNKKGINIIGDISIAAYKLLMRVPTNIPINIPIQHCNMEIIQKPKKFMVLELKPTIKYIINTKNDGNTLVSGISISNLDM